MATNGHPARRAILLSCGSFNPPTIAHLRMMEVARDYLSSQSPPWSVVEGIFSPASSAYVHKPLASDEHRIAMLHRATESSGWLRVDDWEARRGEWSRTRQVLAHHREIARQTYGDPALQCFLVAGGDLVDSFTRLLPDGSQLWSTEDVEAIVRDFGLVVLFRPDSSPAATLSSMGFEESVIHIVVDDSAPNDVSSTRLRKALAESRSIKYATPDGVIDYIYKHGLYGSEIKIPLVRNGHRISEENGDE